MKATTKILAVILSCLTVFSCVSLGAYALAIDGNDLTTTVQETAASPESEGTTTPIDETTAPQETTKEDIKLPEAPKSAWCEGGDGKCTVYWDVVPMADGYDVFVKADGEWVYNTSSSVHYTYASLKGLICTKEYEIGVRSFIIVDDVKYYSESIATCVGGPGDTLPSISLQARVYFGGFNLKWNAFDCIDGYLLYIRQNNKWLKIATISSSAEDEYDYKFNGMKNDTNYKFAIKAFVKSDNGTKYSDVSTCTVNSGKADKIYGLSKSSETASSVTLKWNELQGATGYRVYKYDFENKKYVAVKTTSKLSYTVTNINDGNKYYFKVRAYYKADGKNYWGSFSDTLKVDSIGKTKLSKAKVTSSAITLKWKAVEGAAGYRLYKYDAASKKYVKVKTTSALSATVTGLNASTSYAFKLRAYYKRDGETKWCTISDKLSVVTSKKAVTPQYVSKYKKYFADAAWSMKIGPIDDLAGNAFYLTIALNGDKLCARYDYKNSKLDSYRYLINLNSGKVYLIYDKNKVYYVLPSDEAYYIAVTIASLAAVLDMSDAKGVKAETTYVSGKTGVIETYTDKENEITKKYTFIDGKMKYVKLEYSDGSSEGFNVISVADKPVDSLLKLPSNYKKKTY